VIILMKYYLPTGIKMDFYDVVKSRRTIRDFSDKTGSFLANMAKRVFLYLFFLYIIMPIFANDIPDRDTRTINELQPKMVFINGGTFLMGSAETEPGRGSNEGPQRWITVKSFYIGKYEVTQEEYEEVTGTNPSHFRGENLPVENVSWYDAIEYCNALSLREGLAPAYTIDKNLDLYHGQWWVIWRSDADGYRLPTEAEWEYACRAGTATPWYSGDSVDDAGWYRINSKSQSHSVGELVPNAWGLYDMHGNVWEMCWDRHRSYSFVPRYSDPMEEEMYELGRIQGNIRVSRGGCWDCLPRSLRSAARRWHSVFGKDRYMGFRIARNADGG
jgi:formylglycine-generating enzyme required for sulfatase activity